MKKTFYLLVFLVSLLIINTVVLTINSFEIKKTILEIKEYQINKSDSLLLKEIERENMYHKWIENNNIKYREITN